MSGEQWWFDLKSKSVVSDDTDSKVADRLGPYASRSEAERALQTVDERNAAYDNDPRWNDD